MKELEGRLLNWELIGRDFEEVVKSFGFLGVYGWGGWGGWGDRLCNEENNHRDFTGGEIIILLFYST